MKTTVKASLCSTVPRCSSVLSLHQKTAHTEAATPAFLRRNSFTPLSSQDQIKRPRLYSMGNPPQTRTSQAPALPNMQFSEASEGAELTRNEVSLLNSILCQMQRTVQWLVVRQVNHLKLTTTKESFFKFFLLMHKCFGRCLTAGGFKV